MTTEIRQIGLVGAGLVGAAWAAFYAGQGLRVRLYDSDPAAAESGHAKAIDYLEFLRDHELLSPDQFDNAGPRIQVADDLAHALEGAQLVHESVSERYDVKKAVFKEIDASASPEAIIASSTSGLLISEIQKGLVHPERALIAHPFNPVHLVPLVELVPGELTRSGLAEEVKAFYESIGKIPIIVKKDIPGMVANRLQAALWREAIDLVVSGVVTVEDVDKAVNAGPGMRWALMGQHLIFHLGGGEGGMSYFIDHIGSLKRRLWRDMATWTELPPETKDALVAGLEEEMGSRTMEEVAAWRDEKLVGLLKLLDH